MKTKLLLLFWVVIPFTLLSQPFYDGISAFSAGIGYGNTFYGGKDYSASIPGLMAAFDHGVLYVPMGADVDGVLSVGLMAGWTYSKYSPPNWNNDLWLNYNVILIAARANYYFLFSDTFVPYLSLLGGYNISIHNWGGTALPFTNYDFKESAFALGALAGSRFYFSEYIGMFAEVGWGVNLFTLGVTFNMY